MRGMTLGLTAMLLLAVGHELDAQSVTPDRVQRQGRMEMHERRELRRDRPKSGWIAVSFTRTGVRSAGTSGIGLGEVSFATIVGISIGIIGI